MVVGSPEQTRKTQEEESWQGVRGASAAILF